MGENATIPPRIARQRTVASTSWFIFCIFGSFTTNLYFIPIYFQAIKGSTAEGSGIQMIPLIVSNVITIVVAGVLTAKTGHYVPFFYGCAILSSIGCGLLTTWGVNSSAGAWIGYQIIEGIGLGLALQLPPVAVQAVSVPIRHLSKLLLTNRPVGASRSRYINWDRNSLDVRVLRRSSLRQRWKQSFQQQTHHLYRESAHSWLKRT